MCENSSILSMLLFVKNILNLITILIPIILIIYTIIDLVRNQIDVNKKYLTVIGKRFFFAVLIFLVPTIVSLIVNNLDEENKYLSCYKEATNENIKYYRAKEEAEKKKEEELKNIEQEKALVKRKQIENTRNVLSEQNKKKLEEKKNENTSTSTNVINQGNTCIFFQGDYEAYQYTPSCGSMKDCGCGTTSAAVILCTMLKDTSYEPVRVTRDVCKLGGCTKVGTSLPVLLKYINSKGFKTEVYDNHYEQYPNFTHSKAKEDIYNALKNNNMILFHITTHYFVLTGIENGKIRIVQVGNKAQSQKTYTYEELRAMVENMIKNKKHREIQGYVIVSR